MSIPLYPRPDARMVFPKVDYRHALEYYAEAKQLLTDWGLCFNKHLYGVIHASSHPDKPDSGGSIPDRLIDDPRWEVAVDFWFDGPEMRQLLGRIKLPPGGRLELDPPSPAARS